MKTRKLNRLVLSALVAAQLMVASSVLAEGQDPPDCPGEPTASSIDVSSAPLDLLTDAVNLLLQVSLL